MSVYPFPYPGPVPFGTNFPIHPEYYAPRKFNIAAIGLGRTTLVTTDLDHDFVIGQLVRLLIPEFFGSYQLNGLEGYVTSIPSTTQVVVQIDSRFSNAFIPTPTYSTTPAQIVPVGDVNSGQINSTGRVNNKTYIEGSFINISPN